MRCAVVILWQEVLITRDGRRIVECNHCGLWFTSPRINGNTWVEYLKEETERSIEFTENRLKSGVASSHRTKYSPPDWRKRRAAIENQIIDEIEEHWGGKVNRLHDVGCGVGFLLEAARNRGIEASGNDLNRYACKVMKERLGLKVYNDILPSLKIEEGSLDAIVFRDYIEHTYHPLQDLKAAYKFLRPGGVIWIETFHVDCHTFQRLKGDWDMLFWNHVFHFSTKSLQDMVVKAGFVVKHIDGNYNNPLVKVIMIKA
ncbi:hypothetical protein ES703_35342 [subsurface metagenome]